MSFPASLDIIGPLTQVSAGSNAMAGDAPATFALGQPARFPGKANKRAVSKRWVFTLNNPTDDEIKTFKPGCYGRWQLERGASGTLHMQGACVFASANALSGVRALCSRAHWEAMRGSLDEALSYAWKDDTAITPPHRTEWGTKPAGQGARTDLREAAAIVVSRGEAALALEMPWTILQYPNGVKRLAELRPIVPPPPPTPTWRPWQAELMDILGEVPDNRTIHWYTDEVGAAGKSTLVKYVVASGKPASATVLSGKVADMSFGYKGERIVFFDIPRSVAENMEHLAGMAEKLKDGLFFSSKYDSGAKVFEPPHVVFFSNSPPASGLWSADRLRHTQLTTAVAFAASSQPPKMCVECVIRPAAVGCTMCPQCM